MRKILKKIYQELVAMRKELQAIQSDLEPSKLDADTVSRQIQECLTEQIEECVGSVSVKVEKHFPSQLLE